jgi:hypothetical protein
MPPAKSYVPGFEHDIFISYSHVDNLGREGRKGWVEEFHEALKNRIAPRVGRFGLVSMWRDKELDGSQVFDEVIQHWIARSAVFLALNSKGYLESNYCRRELQSFCQQARHSRHGLQIGERRRVLNVLLTNLHHSIWPEELAGTSGFLFHDGDAGSHSDHKGRIPEPLRPNTDRFETQLRELADAIYHLLEDLKKRQTEPSEQSVRKGYIYLADTTDTLQGFRERLAADITQKGRIVVSGLPPPYDAATHAARVQTAVEEAGLSVHLLDGLPGRSIQDDSATTYPRKQVEIALGTVTPQLVWLPPPAELGVVSSTEQRMFLESLERGPRAKGNYYFVRSPPERLVQEILDKLESLETHHGTVVQEDSPSVLLETHLKDQRIAWELGAYLVDRGLQPFIHPETDEPSAGIKAFEDQLTRVKTLVVFFGRVSREWVEQRVKCALQFVARQLAGGVEPTLEACYIYVLPPTKQAPLLGPSIFRIDVLDNSQSDRFDPDAAAPLLAALVRGMP